MEYYTDINKNKMICLKTDIITTNMFSFICGSYISHRYIKHTYKYIYVYAYMYKYSQPVKEEKIYKIHVTHIWNILDIYLTSYLCMTLIRNKSWRKEASERGKEGRKRRTGSVNITINIYYIFGRNGFYETQNYL